MIESVAERYLRLGLQPAATCDQVTGLRTYAGVLAGESWSYADDVEGCYGVRSAWTDEAVFAVAHERLEALLPGDGPLAGRHERWRNSMLIPAGQIERRVAAVIEEARTQTRDLVELPAGEGVVLEIVHDEPWLGSWRSTRATLAIRRSALARSTCLVRGRGLLEETVVLVPTRGARDAERRSRVTRPVITDCCERLQDAPSSPGDA